MAKTRPAVRGIAAGVGFSLKKMDPDSAALSHLDQTLASASVKKIVRPKTETAVSEFKSLGSEAMPLTGTMLVKFRQHFNKIPVYGSLVTVELDKNHEFLAINSSLGDGYTCLLIRYLTLNKGNVTVKKTLLAVFCGLTLMISAYSTAHADDGMDMFIIRSTDKSPDALSEALKAYSEKANWQFFEPTKVKKGEVTLIKICIPQVGVKLWPLGLHIAAMLPCGNLAAYKGKDGKTEVSMLKASYMYKIYPNPVVEEAVKVAEPLLNKMLDEVTK